MDIYIQIYKVKQRNRVMIYVAKKNMYLWIFENKNPAVNHLFEENVFGLRFV